MNGGFGGAGGSSVQANAAADLELVETEQLGFNGVPGKNALRLLPTPWPSEQFPPTAASLLSVASGRGLLAAAGPDVLILADTKSVRQALVSTQNNDVFQPRVSMPVPRVSQVAFSSDESCLVITAESGGGLAVYDVDALLGGSRDSAFQVPTDGVAVRHLLPNPNKENSHQFVVVLDDGKLLLADLKQRQFTSGANGSPVFKDQVSSACWSRLGKQIVAGLANGTAAQVDLQGNVKAKIPQPPNLYHNQENPNVPLPVTSIYWLETLDFLIIHAPVNPPDTADMAFNDAIYHLVHRDKQSGACSFHKFGDDPCGGLYAGRLPAHHFIQRVREWPPNLDDTVILGSTLSEGVGLITRSKEPLAKDAPTHLYTTTAPVQDTRRAVMPTSFTGDMTDIYMVGMALDLSVDDKTWRPIPGEEDLIEYSPVPLPALCALNHEGVLSEWSLVYNESVRQGTRAPGMTRDLEMSSENQGDQQKVSEGQSQMPPASSTTPAATQLQTPPQPAFGQSSAPKFGGPSVFGSQPASDKPASPAPSTPAFGKPSASGAVAFGTPSGFGQTGGMGANKPSPWGAPPQSQGPSVPSFGQPSGAFGGNASSQSPFASFSKPEGSAPGASPFAAFAKPSGGDGKGLASPFTSFSKDEKPAGTPFSSFASGGGSFGNHNTPASPFAAAGKQNPGMPADPSFGSTVTLNSTTGSFGSGTAFGQGSGFGSSSFGKPSDPKEQALGSVDSTAQSSAQPSGLSGFGSSGFKIGSTFKGDGTAKDDGPKPKDPGAGLFGSNFGSSLGIGGNRQEPSTPIKEEPDAMQGPKLGEIPEASTTPASPPKQPQAQPEEAPLPPDFTSAPPKEDDDIPQPVPEDAPLPPDFGPSNPQKDDDIPIAGSPPLDVGNEKFSAPTSSAGEEQGPPEDDDEEDWSEEDGEEGDEHDEEGDAEDGDDDEDDEDDEQSADEEDDRTVEDPAGLSAFESRVTPASPKRNQPQEETNTPPTDKKTSYTPAGFPKPNINFPPPSRPLQESPRSPSPVRSVTGPAQLRQSSKQPPAPAFGRISVPPPQPVERPASRSRASTPQPPAQPIDLEDEEDARIQAMLDAPIEPRQDLPEFIAHHDYNGGSDKDGIAGQMEKIYRDINSMIDTLGLNTRSLRAFVQGHSQARDSNSPLKRSDLEGEEPWVFAEVSELQSLIEGISNGLEQGKLDEPERKAADLQDEEQELNRLLTKASEVRRQITSRADPELRAAHHNAPLSSEAAAQQSELRQGVQRVQKLLAEAEEAMSLLRADMAALPSAGPSSNAPTVEAVTNTILKMTAMVEQRSGDVDVLESQIRRLPRGVASLKLDDDYEDDLVNTMRGSKLLAASNGSPRATPPPNGRARTAFNGDPLGMSGMFGSRFLRTPPAGGRRAVRDLGTSALGRSVGSVGGSAKKKMQDVTAEEAQAYISKRDRRFKVLDALRDGVERKGARVVAVQK